MCNKHISNFMSGSIGKEELEKIIESNKETMEAVITRLLSKFDITEAQELRYRSELDSEAVSQLLELIQVKHLSGDDLIHEFARIMARIILEMVEEDKTVTYIGVSYDNKEEEPYQKDCTDDYERAIEENKNPLATFVIGCYNTLSLRERGIVAEGIMSDSMDPACSSIIMTLVETVKQNEYFAEASFENVSDYVIEVISEKVGQDCKEVFQRRMQIPVMQKRA